MAHMLLRGHGTARHGEKSISWKWVIRVNGDDNDADATRYSVYLVTCIMHSIVFIGDLHMKLIGFAVGFIDICSCSYRTLVK